MREVIFYSIRNINAKNINNFIYVNELCSRDNDDEVRDETFTVNYNSCFELCVSHCSAFSVLI